MKKVKEWLLREGEKRKDRKSERRPMKGRKERKEGSMRKGRKEGGRGAEGSTRVKRGKDL